MITNQLHIRIGGEEYKILGKLAAQVGISRNALGRILLQGAIQAVSKSGSLPLPLHFAIVEKMPSIRPNHSPG